MRENKGKSIIALPSEYVVIDTETTGLDYECCQLIEVAAVKYSDGAEIGRFSSLVKPEPVYVPNDADEWVPEYVDEFITDLTGITNEMLEAAPGPHEVMPQFLEFIGNAVLVGHNVNFDINFLYDAAEAVGRTLSNNFIDNLRISRKVFPELPHHRLADIAKVCAVAQPDAHRAEADCLVTAGCFEYMKAKILEEQTEADFARLFDKSWRRQEALANVTASTTDIDETNPIFGKVVVFTGALSTMSRMSAFQIAADLGAIPQDSVTKKTNFLVIGKSDFVKSVKEGKTTKMKKAESLIAKGNDLSILSEDAFFDLIAEYRVQEMTEVQVYEVIKPHLTEVLLTNCVGVDSIKAVERKDFTGVYYVKPEQTDEYGKPIKTRAEVLAVRIIARKGKYAFEVAGADGYESIPFSPTPAGIEPVTPALQRALAAVIDAGACEYGCCSRVEACSNARHCVQTYPHIAANCNYRKVLKSGKIFYGENRNID